MGLKRAIPGFEGSYEIDSDGYVQSLDKLRRFGKGGCRIRRIKGRVLKPSLCGDGYECVTLSHNQKHKKFLVHRLVAAAFIPNPHSKPEVNHKDGDKTNNHVDNLEWVTRSENEVHAYRVGLKEQGNGVRSLGSKYTYFAINPMTNIIEHICIGDSHLIELGLTPTHVRRVCAGRGKTHKNLIFKRIKFQKTNKGETKHAE